VVVVGDRLQKRQFSMTDNTLNVEKHLRELIDERDIRGLLHRYASSLDQKDWPLLADCFHTSATAHYETIGLIEGQSAIVELCCTALKPMSRTHHLIGNVDVQVSNDTATSTCYLQAQHVRPMEAGDEMNIMAGKYEDELIRTEQGWRILRRKLHVWWTLGNPNIHEL
jgi:3-phenylpropionate/cinnamic acid dioxygenase small subunit